MSVVRISSNSPTPEELKALKKLEEREKRAELALLTARNVLRAAQADHTRARREYRKATAELWRYREKIL